MNAPLPIFLTAYDPAELPGGTIDPLGFTAGYLALADQLFPEMTAAANQATYFPMLCAGLWIAESEGKEERPGAAGRRQRVEIALRFERLWALSCALAEQRAGNDSGGERSTDMTAGLRGIRYIERELERLTQARAKETGSEFAVLAQQYRYGAFGIYGSVAQALRLLEKTTLVPTPAFGEALGQSFLETTAEPRLRNDLKRAACDPKARIGLSTLAAWGAKAHAGARLSGDARKRLRQAVLGNLRRRQMLELVEEVFEKWSGEWSDRTLLGACVTWLEERQEQESSLIASLRAALAYDAFLREVLLVFERMLWLCGKTDEAELSVVFADEVVTGAAERIAERARDLLATVERLLELGNTDLAARGRGVVELARYFASGPPVAESVRQVIGRHARIQWGKLERGRPKQAWLIERDGRFALTSARFVLRTAEPTSAGDVHAPDWRFRAALSLLQAVGTFEDETS
jgi:hypothetical protein